MSATCPTLRDAIVVAASVRNVSVLELVKVVKAEIIGNGLANADIIGDFLAELDEIAKLHIQ